MIAAAGKEADAPPLTHFWKLTPAIAITAAVGLLLAGIVIALWFDSAAKAQQIGEIRAQSRILAATVTAALVFDDRKAAQEYVAALKANPEIQAAGVYDANGALFAGYSRTPSPLPPELALGTTIDDQAEIVTPASQGGSAIGTVYLRIAAEPISRRVARFSVIGALVGMAALLVGVLGVARSTLASANEELALRAADLDAANRSLRDEIGARMKTEEALRQAQKMEAIDQLTGGVAHDFNNLLQVVLGNLDALRYRMQQKHPLRPEEVLSRIDAAVRAGRRGATLTQRLLAFSRRQPLSPQPLDVGKLVLGMSDMLRRTLGETIVIETVAAGGLWWISADQNELENALLNLAVNARDAMPRGGKLTIEAANAQLDAGYAARHEDVVAGQYAMIAVSDTGTGMTGDVLLKAFDPFFTTKDVGQGTGLGLSQVYGFVKQSGGHVKIYSEPGAGTTVKLYLPRHSGPEAAAEEPAEQRALPAGTAEEVILVVEDEPDVRAYTASLLRELGYGVIEAGDARQALETLRATPKVRLLFTDVGLPGLNGRQLVEQARLLRPRLRILYTTGYARNAIVHHGRLDPDVQLITKPFTYAALADKVRSVFDHGPAA